MKRFAKILGLASILTVSAIQPAKAAVSIGAVLSSPEIFGAFLSVWPMQEFTVDFRATLGTFDGGVTGHIPLAHGNDRRHDLLLSALGGYVHSDSGFYNHGQGARVIGQIGYGFASVLDLRLLGGVESYDTPAGWQTSPSFSALLGYVF